MMDLRLSTKSRRVRRLVGLAVVLATAYVVAGVTAVLVFQDDESQAKAQESAAAYHRILAAIAPRYTPTSPYLGMRSLTYRPGPAITFAHDRLPRVTYDFVTGRQTNPVTIAQYGLWAHSAYVRRGHPRHRRIVLRVADWLTANQQRDGSWLYRFDLPYGELTLRQPWPSALAQGQSISLLTRAYRVSGDTDYRRVALRALAPLERRIAAGGVRSCLLGDCRRPFYEEAPTTPRSHILNGFMYTLIGLYDLASIAPRSSARSMYLEGRRTLHEALPHYDREGLATYDLTPLTLRQETSPATQGYQVAHVQLLRALDSLSANGRFAAYASRWQRNLARARP
jgi:heparosan-N-sulfate-glucuronate 5-epimerase